MHPLVFGFKRAHWASVRWGYEVLGQFGLTPARFEYLYVLACGWTAPGSVPTVKLHTKPEPEPMLQSHLRRILDVSRATVSEMLQVLEERGWIVREALPPRRTREVIARELKKLEWRSCLAA